MLFYVVYIIYIAAQFADYQSQYGDIHRFFICVKGKADGENKNDTHQLFNDLCNCRNFRPINAIKISVNNRSNPAKGKYVCQNAKQFPCLPCS